ncbi:Trm112 family protein [Candidatus Puniceispirillum sp.]|uniref:Trm112 family protein n=1 Tax=Candidatus Puniceispirillum sp. TaxID=2026719 RepID=UPI003F695C2E
MSRATDMTNDKKTDDVTNGSEMMIDPTLMDVLVCPIARCPLVYNAETNELISVQARKAYPVRDGVPIMLIDEARDLDDNDVPA